MWHMTTISVLGMQRQEDHHELKPSLGCLVSKM